MENKHKMNNCMKWDKLFFLSLGVLLKKIKIFPRVLYNIDFVVIYYLCYVPFLVFPCSIYTSNFYLEQRRRNVKMCQNVGNVALRFLSLASRLCHQDWTIKIIFVCHTLGCYNLFIASGVASSISRQ